MNAKTGGAKRATQSTARAHPRRVAQCAMIPCDACSSLGKPEPLKVIIGARREEVAGSRGGWSGRRERSEIIVTATARFM